MIPRNRVNNSVLYTKFMDTFAEIISRESYINGPYVSKFEKEFCKKFGGKYGILTANSTIAITLLFRTLNINCGITTNTSYIGHWLGAQAVADTIVLGPSNNYTWDVDTSQYRRLIKEIVTFYPECSSGVRRRFGVIVPHLYGSRSEAMIDDIKSVHDNVWVIEDMSQSHGLQPHGATDAVIYSLYPTKPFGGLSDGCIITTNDAILATNLRSNLFYGYSAYDQISMKSSNFRLSELNASFLLTKLKYGSFNWEMHTRILLGRMYQNRLLKINSNRVHIPNFSSDCVFHMFPVYVDDRVAFTTFMYDNGVEVGSHYPYAISDVVKYDIKSTVCANNSNWNEHVVTLPLSAWHTTNEIDTVCNVIERYCNERL